MSIRDDIGDTRPEAASLRAGLRAVSRCRGRVAILRRIVLGLATLAALAGCGMSDGAGSLMVDPGRYSAYRCNDLVARWKILVAREKELRGLIDKAKEGGGGAVIGSLAYRTDYDAALSDEKLLQRTAAEKNCGFTPEFQSDQTIR